MLKTALNDFHRNHSARMVDFAGWDMPLMYTGIIDEHHWTRRHCSAFDVSHMGRLRFDGPDAGVFLERICTRRIGDMKVGQCRYGHVCRDDGGILDDVILSRFESHWGMVCNASNREKLLGWFRQHMAGLNVTLEDQTLETAMLAIQGPEAIETIDRLLPFPVSDIKRYHFKHGGMLGVEYTIYRSGYTGEDGVEIVVPAKFAAMGAETLLAKSAEIGRPIRLAGLGARDTLRLEAAMPLYGHELTEDWDSLSAGQAWCVALDKEFIGRDAMLKKKEAGGLRGMIGFEIDGKRIARQGATIYMQDRAVGVVTSGTQSPTLEKVIGMGLVSPDASAAGTRLEIDLRGTRLTATVVALPFYKKK